MFIDFVNAIFSGCTTDMERFFAMVVFIFILELFGEMIQSLVGGTRR